MSLRHAPLLGSGVSAIVAEYGQPSLLASPPQFGSISLSNATSATATITSVDPTNSLLFLLGENTAGTSSDGYWTIRLAFTNATMITATRQASDGVVQRDVYFVVIPLKPGVAKSITRGTISLNGVTSAAATLSPGVDITRSVVTPLGFEINNVGAGSINDKFPRIVLTNTTTVTATCSVSIATTYTVGYQVLELFSVAMICE